jgi:hypothetical protein
MFCIPNCPYTDIYYYVHPVCKTKTVAKVTKQQKNGAIRNERESLDSVL